MLVVPVDDLVERLVFPGQGLVHRNAGVTVVFGDERRDAVGVAGFERGVEVVNRGGGRGG
ncbi:hypothetical protein D3C87_1943280 [compost metagenome]